MHNVFVVEVWASETRKLQAYHVFEVEVLFQKGYPQTSRIAKRVCPAFLWVQGAPRSGSGGKRVRPLAEKISSCKSFFPTTAQN